MANSAVSIMFLEVEGNSGYYPILIDDITSLDTTTDPASLLIGRKSTGKVQIFPRAGYVPPPPFVVQGVTSYPTLAAALAAVEPGGTITVEPGSYLFAEAAAHIPASAGNVTISAAPGTVTFDGQGFNATGSNDRARGVFGKALVYAGDPIAVTIIGVGFVNCGDPSDADVLAAVYAESGASLVLIDCTFDGCGDGVFGASTAGTYQITRCTFGAKQPNYGRNLLWKGAAG